MSETNFLNHSRNKHFEIDLVQCAYVTTHVSLRLIWPLFFADLTDLRGAVSPHTYFIRIYYYYKYKQEAPLRKYRSLHASGNVDFK
jgi:hypothetical protein